MAAWCGLKPIYSILDLDAKMQIPFVLGKLLDGGIEGRSPSASSKAYKVEMDWWQVGYGLGKLLPQATSICSCI
jgi:hypothetical protein